MLFNADDPRNALLVRHLGNDAAPCTTADAHDDPYYAAGCHPDVVTRVWDQLGAGLGADCRVLLYGRPALVQPLAGVALALAYGTEYALRVPVTSVGAACALGCRRERRWTGGGSTNIESALGRGWLFGCYADAEPAFIRMSFDELDPHAARGEAGTGEPPKGD